MISVRGFCDVNVCIDGKNRGTLKNTCQKLYDLGYQTVAINTLYDGINLEPKKKKKKGDPQDKHGDIVPEPSFGDIIKEFQGKLSIYHRLTVSIDNQMQAHKLSQSANAKKYTILAIIPRAQSIYQHACSTMDIDLISFDPDNIGVVRCNRKMHNLAVSRGISFEIMYTPAVRDSTARKNIIQLSHNYHAFGKSKNIIVSSGATNPFHVRGPYDIINLGLILGLSEEQAKAAITVACRHLLIKAAGRRIGKTIVIASKTIATNINNNKITDLESEKMEVEESEQPAQKRLKQD